MLAAARALLDSEARALARASARLDGRFERAVELVLACGGKVITSGIGKSGFVARKLAATLCATGTPAAYLHPAEAMHGDLGLVEPGDVMPCWTRAWMAKATRTTWCRPREPWSPSRWATPWQSR